LKTLTIGFSKPANRVAPIGSWLIRLFERTPYSHVFIKFYSETLNCYLIYESVGSGIRFIGTKAWEAHAKEVQSFQLPVSNSNYIHMLQYCVHHAGSKYSYWQNIGVVIARLFKLKHNPFTTGRNCSELVYEVLRSEGYSIDKNKNLITPKDIFNLLSQSK
jgi:hypothetical protein